MYSQNHFHIHFYEDLYILSTIIGAKTGLSYWDENCLNVLLTLSISWLYHISTGSISRMKILEEIIKLINSNIHPYTYIMVA